MSGYETTGKPLGFSWSPCDRCKTKLGGERHEWFVMEEDPNTKSFIESERGACCTDCLFEIEYGPKHKG